MGSLFVVGTPIGNLDDMSPRGIETLKSVDFICAEDTRVTVKLLNRFDIKKPMISYHEHNLREKGEQIIARLLAGENGAIVTDAGMPCISDPGEDLVYLCHQNGIRVVVIPGPSAVISALAMSGLKTSRFSFEGFLSTNKGNRKIHLEEIKNDTRTLVFYEAPHKLIATLEDMLSIIGDRKISLCREITKIHEEAINTTLSGAIEYYREKSPKGEYVLVIEGAVPRIEAEITLEDAVVMAQKLTAQGIRHNDAAKEISKVTGLKKSDIYKLLLEQ